MIRKAKKKSYTNKLLDAWQPPEAAGDPLGCVATTFTFSPVFFEEECVGRFLQMQSDAIEDGPTYIIEREEKLADVKCVSVLVDINHCKGTRSLRWDLLPVRLHKAILHAKVSLLYWQSLIRIIIASANLTEDGYRRNQEIFGILDYTEGSNAPIEFLDNTIAFLHDAANFSKSADEEASPALNRVIGLLDSVAVASKTWGHAEPQQGRKAPRVHLVLAGPGRPSIFDQVSALWPEGTPPLQAEITSPFFDPPGIPNMPAEKLWSILRQRGEASVTFNLIAEDEPGEPSVFLKAPREILSAKPTRMNTKTYLNRISLKDESADAVYRPLHLKSIWFSGHEWHGYLIGSSNFTSSGTGIGKQPNLEANILYLVSQKGNSKAVRLLKQGAIDKEPMGSDLTLVWQTEMEANEDEPSDNMVLLPSSFGSATYFKQNGSGSVELKFNSDPPAGWQIYKYIGSNEILTNEMGWQMQGKPARLTLDWTAQVAPSGFEVSWKGCDTRVWWPVNVDRATSLPPPDILKDLPLDILVNILTSARPLHQVLKIWIAKRKGLKPNNQIKDIIDPHKRVDTSTFLLQKTYRVTAALIGLRKKLERPVVSEESLAWRLRGPIGVSAVAQAIVKEARTTEERAFLLTELAMEISRSRPKTVPGCLNVQEINKHLSEMIIEIKDQVFEDLTDAPSTLKQYIRSAFREAIP